MKGNKIARDTLTIQIRRGLGMIHTLKAYSKDGDLLKTYHGARANSVVGSYRGKIPVSVVYSQ